MDKKVAGIIITVIGSIALLICFFSFLTALNTMYANSDYSSQTASRIVPVISWGIPGLILLLAGIHIIRKQSF